MKNAAIKKVLIIKLCCLGDIIQTTPAIRAVGMSGAEVHFLCGAWSSDLVDMVPYISKKFVINMNDIFSVLTVIGKLRREKYDLIINFHRDIKSYLFAAVLDAKRRAGFNWRGQDIFLTDKFRFDENAHEAERYSSVVRGMGFEDRGQYTEIRAPHAKKEAGEKIKIGFFPGGGKNPGTVMTTKRWPVSGFIELAGAMKEYEIYVFGGKTDADAVLPIKEAVPGVVIEETKGLKELAGRISGMDLFIAGDTGPLHMAAALGVKTIGLFGPTSPELVGPAGERAVNLRGKTDCAPCYLPGTVHKREFLKCADNVCMKSISVEKVMEAAKALLKRM